MTKANTAQQAKKAIREFPTYREAARHADKVLGKPHWVETRPRTDEVAAEGHYVVKPLGPVAAKKRAGELLAIKTLRSMLRPGMVVYTNLLHRSSSGTFRVVDAHIVKGGEIFRLSGLIAEAGIADWNAKHEGLAAPGCGLDVGFEIVYGLSRTLYPDGYTCPGDKCQSNEHRNDHTCKRKKGYRHTGDGGYGFLQNWL